jgi:hypothetical protein
MAHAYGFLEPAESAVIESHVLTCPDCREELSRLTGERLLVAFELSLEPGTSTARAAAPPARRGRTIWLRPVLAASAVAAALVLGLLALSRVLVTAPPEEPLRVAPEPPPRVGSEDPRPVPPPSRIVYVPKDPDPELRARIAELEKRLAELGAGSPPGDRHAAMTPEEALEAHDWSGLAELLARLAPEVRAGRLPEDPDTLARYAESLRDLEELAKAADLPTTLSGLARDPRTGPRLFVAVLARSWPEAPQIDLDRAGREAEDAIRRYRDETAAAATDEEREAAEANLSRSLADTVEAFEEQQGAPAEDFGEPQDTPTREVQETPQKEETGRVESSTTNRILTTAGYRAVSSGR